MEVALQSGETLWDTYRIEYPIGVGGMAEVYCVTPIGHSEQRFAAKIVKPQHLRSPKRDLYINYFMRESRIHSRLQHPNIVHCHNVYHNMPPYGMLLEYIDGESVKHIIDQFEQKQRSPLTNSDILRILRDVADALTYMHGLGIYHCDLKPGNILIDRRGRSYLTDFGISQHSKDVYEETAITRGGTKLYMAPEQFRGEPVSPATDVYSLGITLYELFTGGFRPFADTDEGNETRVSEPQRSLEEKHLFEEPQLPSHFNTAIPPDIESILLKALKKNPAERFRTVRQMTYAIEGALQTGAARIIHGLKRQPRPAVAQLVGTRGRYMGKVFPIQRNTLLLGRSKVCDVILDDGNVSRRHLLIRWGHDHGGSERFFMQDQNSSGGTRLNGRRALAHELHHDDLITIGQNNFRFEYLHSPR